MDKDLDPKTASALAQCESMIKAGSKSFSLASRLFSPEVKRAAFFLYGWCRHCDDLVDDGHPGDTREARQERLSELIRSTRSALAGDEQNAPVFVALQFVTRRYSIPEHYPVELLEGMRMDVCGTEYRSQEELLLYCYRVAGTVGLMMSHVMGISDERALKHAADLGIAMQLTNIARDLVGDAKQGRCYVPLAWLEEEQIAPADIAFGEHREKLSVLAARLLSAADDYYRSGDEGLGYLAFRSACAVGAARHVYAEIGNLIRLKGAAAWDGRTFTSKARKLKAVARGFAQVFRSIPKRLAKPWSQVPIKTVWKFSHAG
jgi:phytoene synthase